MDTDKGEEYSDQHIGHKKKKKKRLLDFEGHVNGDTSATYYDQNGYLDDVVEDNYEKQKPQSHKKKRRKIESDCERHNNIVNGDTLSTNGYLDDFIDEEDYEQEMPKKKKKKKEPDFNKIDGVTLSTNYEEMHHLDDFIDDEDYGKPKEEYTENNHFGWDDSIIVGNTEKYDATIESVVKDSVEMPNQNVSVQSATEGLVWCMFCEKKFTQSRNLRRHQRLMHVHECPVCLATFKLIEEFGYHIEMRHPELNGSGSSHQDAVECAKNSQSDVESESATSTETIIVCSYCDLNYLDKDSFMKHVTSQHGWKKRFKCNRCDKSYFTSEILKRHKKSRHSSPP